MASVTERVPSRPVLAVVLAYAVFLLLGTVFYGSGWVWRMYVVAWALLPFLAIALGLLTYFDERADTNSPPEPLAVLRERYARGQIDETEFERRTERLLETQSRDRLRTGERTDR